VRHSEAEAAATSISSTRIKNKCLKLAKRKSILYLNLLDQRGFGTKLTGQNSVGKPTQLMGQFYQAWSTLANRLIGNYPINGVE